MTRMTGPDCAVMCNLINTHTHTQGSKHKALRVQLRTVERDCILFVASDQSFRHNKYYRFLNTLIPYSWEDQYEWHRMTRMTGLDCAFMCNLINAFTHTHFDPPLPWED